MKNPIKKMLSFLASLFILVSSFVRPSARVEGASLSPGVRRDSGKKDHPHQLVLRHSKDIFNNENDFGLYGHWSHSSHQSHYSHSSHSSHYSHYSSW